jgi:hypothetical protein
VNSNAATIEPLGNPEDRLAALGDIYENCSDSGNARRMATLFRHRARYCVSEKCWYIKFADRWRPDADLAIWRIAKDTVSQMLQEAWAHPYCVQRAEHTKWALKSESTARLRAMIENAQSEMVMTAAEKRCG